MSIRIADGSTLDEQIQVNAEREKLDKQMARMEKLAREEGQPKKNVN